MIWESSYWKDPLIECAARFEEYSSNKELDEPEFVQIEKDMFISFYAIRKLMDTEKLTDKAKETKIKLVWHPNVATVHYMNSHHLHKLYDFSTSGEELRTLKFLCDQMVHSYVFGVSEHEDGGLAGFYFSSDRDKNKKVYSIGVNQVIEIFNLIGHDYPSGSERTWNPEKGEYDTKVW